MEQLSKHPLLVVPVKFSWELLAHGSHNSHLEMISSLSQIVDALCFDLVNYINCELGQLSCERKPASPGQLAYNPMMSAALLIKSDAMDSVLLAGAAFTHMITKGLGLDLQQPEWDRFPQNGEIGKLVTHALSLYSQMLQTQAATPKFIQALSLIEFLAYPDKYQSFKKVKTIVSRYVTQCPAERKSILDRFEELTGKKDEVTGEEKGLRTNIVHIGARLEDLVKNRSEREKIFRELDVYIRAIIDHMIKFSYMSYDEYEVIKDNM